MVSYAVMWAMNADAASLFMEALAIPSMFKV